MGDNLFRMVDFKVRLLLFWLLGVVGLLEGIFKRLEMLKWLLF